MTPAARRRAPVPRARTPGPLTSRGSSLAAAFFPETDLVPNAQAPVPLPLSDAASLSPEVPLPEAPSPPAATFSSLDPELAFFPEPDPSTDPDSPAPVS